jgi:Copper type II ascorbate-dependent monooxygenase, C-terminal domain
MTMNPKLGLLAWLLLGAVGAGCGSTPAPARDLHVQTTFRVEPGQERYECYRKNVDQDVFVSKLATNDAPGVHHQILAVLDQTEPEGVSVCSSVLQSVTDAWIFVGNRSPLTFAMPDGVAYRIPAGSQLVLQTHLFNAGDAALESTLKVELTGMAEAEVVSLAQLVEAGSVQIDLPPGVATQVTGKCTLTEDVSVFGVLPHMHGLGTTFKASIANGGETTMLYNAAFAGETQQFERFAPVAMPAGAPLNVECDYVNSSAARVVYGSSARDEMCFAIAYYYPAIEGRGPLCLK